VSNNILLKDGWRTDNSLWLLIEPELKPSITEFISALHLLQVGQTSPAKINTWLKTKVETFFDRRYNTVVPRFGRAESSNRLFWTNLNDFALVATRLISEGYTTEEGDNFVLAMINAVAQAELCRSELYQIHN